MEVLNIFETSDRTRTSISHSCNCKRCDRSLFRWVLAPIQASLIHVIVGGAITLAAQYLEELDGGDECVILRWYRLRSQTEFDRFLLYQPTVVEFPDQ